MPTHKSELKKGIKHVSAMCSHLDKYIKISDECNFIANELNVNSFYESLVRSVIAQQISSTAALTITNRVKKLTRGKITPRIIANKKDKELKSVGLSASKIKTIKGLAIAHLDKEIDLSKLPDLSDDEVIKMLSSQWGIGRWTAEMFLMFSLGRLNVWPVGDLAVRKGWQISHNLKNTPNEKQLQPIGNPFEPYRSIAAWYCWRVLEPKEPW